ncbi:HNH endonuclease [Phenylobacterium sp.]|uniref:HNH endonuclease n=1 Tax=Phenylobacterium sp. TaxID=1871053 RepID=UPI002721D4DC|nr:HNH endonuclease [Phenylobacterium sp.]MDO8800076.1 HNH endonuclease [Phenylobacterium sp.]
MALVDDADFALVSAFTWRANHGYAMAGGPSDTVQLHTLIMDPPPGFEVDHKNRNGLDCRRSNMRVCTHAQNSRNRRARPSAQGFRGVSAKGGKFIANLMVDGEAIRIGGLPTAIEAAVIYDRLAIKHHGEFATLNFSRDRDWILPEPRLSQHRGARRDRVPDRL